MNGILYICGTPIGNLEDITLRQLRIFKEVDLIAAEDTRHSVKLLNYYKIENKLTSYHEHNKHYKGQKLINLLLEGKNIALITDAGMPGISDPGEDLIKLCYQNNILVTSAPGPTAVITALVLSGLSTRRYVFEGFLPDDKKERKIVLERLVKETRTIVLYVPPHNILRILNELYEKIGDRRASVVREITKKYEELILDKLSIIINYFENTPPKGEFVLVIEGEDENILIQYEKDKWDSITIDEHMDIYIKKGLTKKDAMKQVAKDKGVGKREIYKMLEK